jgi:hypothetical protein
MDCSLGASLNAPVMLQWTPSQALERAFQRRDAFGQFVDAGSGFCRLLCGLGEALDGFAFAAEDAEVPCETVVAVCGLLSSHSDHDTGASLTPG